MRCRKLLTPALLIGFMALGLTGCGDDSDPGPGKSSDEWEMTILDEHGRRLEHHDQLSYPKLVVGRNYRVVGAVPSQVWEQSEEQFLVLETRSTGDPDGWVAYKKIKVQDNRHFDEAFKVGKVLRNVRDYRVRGFPSDGEPDEDDEAGGDTFASPTLTAVAESVLSIRIFNDSKADWNLTLPLGSDNSSLEGYVDDNGNVVTKQCQTDCGDYETVTERLNQGAYADVIYTNPPVGTAVGFYGERADGCLGDCDKYVINWAHKPNNKYTPCSDNMPGFASGENYYIRMTPRTFGSSLDLFIWGDNTPLCSAGLDNGWGNFWDDHPALKNVAEVVAAVAAVAILCVVAPEAVLVIGTGLQGALEGEVVVETAEIGLEVGVADDAGYALDPYTGQITTDFNYRRF